MSSQSNVVQVTLTLDQLLETIRQLDESARTRVAQVLLETATLTEAEQRAWQEWREGERMIEEALRPLLPEIEAYERILPDLQRTHLGQWVALHGGEIVDSDADYCALSQRIEQSYQPPYLIMQVESAELVDELPSPEEIDEHVSV